MQIIFLYIRTKVHEYMQYIYVWSRQAVICARQEHMFGDPGTITWTCEVRNGAFCAYKCAEMKWPLALCVRDYTRDIRMCVCVSWAIYIRVNSHLIFAIYALHICTFMWWSIFIFARRACDDTSSCSSSEFVEFYF